MKGLEDNSELKQLENKKNKKRPLQGLFIKIMKFITIF